MNPTDINEKPPTLRTETESGNVDKIRDILFGSHMRDYEARFGRLEEMLTREAADLRETTRRRLDSLETYVKRELEMLDARLRAERDERTAGSQRHAADLKEAAEGLSRRITEATDQTGALQRDLRREAFDQASSLREELRQLHEQISTLLERRFSELRQNKTDRASLATMFNELALRLNDEFKIPGAEG